MWNIPRGYRGWFVVWEKGGDIFLVHSRPKERKGVECPKCIAPMIFIGDRCACYACGTTFDIGDEIVRIRFGRHNWIDSKCPMNLKYDPSKNVDWYEQLRPGGVQALQEAGE